MNKKEIRNIIMSLRTRENHYIVNNILGKLHMMTEEQIAGLLQEIGDDENAIRTFLEKKILSMQTDWTNEKYPVNNMFTYGVTGNCVHLHMPVDLHQMISEKGVKTTIDTVNLYLLDAIDKVKKLKDSSYYKFEEKDSIYMISPILRLKKEIDFLEDLDFEVNVYKKEDLRDEETREQNEKMQLAHDIFGTEQDVVDAIIGFDTLSSDSWQEKKKAKVKQFNDNGITLVDSQVSK